MTTPTPLPAETPTPAPNPRFVYAVFGTEKSEAVAGLIRSVFGEYDSYELPSGDWLVADKSQQPSKVYDRLVGENTDQLSLILVRVDRVYGLHDVAIWDWIESQKNGRA